MLECLSSVWGTIQSHRCPVTSSSRQYRPPGYHSSLSPPPPCSCCWWRAPWDSCCPAEGGASHFPLCGPRYCMFLSQTSESRETRDHWTWTWWDELYCLTASARPDTITWSHGSCGLPAASVLPSLSACSPSAWPASDSKSWQNHSHVNRAQRTL